MNLTLIILTITFVVSICTTVGIYFGYFNTGEYFSCGSQSSLKCGHSSTNGKLE